MNAVFENYRVKLLAAVSKQRYVTMLPYLGSYRDLVHNLISDVKGSILSSTVINVDYEWLRAKKITDNEIPGWARYFDDFLSKNSPTDSKLVECILSNKFDEYWDGSLVPIRNEDGKIIDSASFGLIGIEFDPKHKNYNNTLGRLPFVSPLSGRPFGAKNNKDGVKFLRMGGDSIKLIATSRFLLIGGDEHSLKLWLDLFYCDEWLEQHGSSVFIKSFLE